MNSIDRPILAFGMPRSGTTWIGKILDSHPSTVYRHEPDSWRRLDGIPLFPEPSHAAEHETEVRAFVDELMAIRADRVCGKRPLFPKLYASRLDVAMFSAQSLLYKAASRARLQVRPPLPPQPRPGSDYRLVWKSIESLGRAGVMLDAVPDARFVHIIRHPCGYVASVLRGEAERRFGHNEAASDFNLYGMACATPQARRHGLSEELLRSLDPAERLAWRWVIYNEKAAEESQSRGNVMALHYEECCARPMAMARLLLEFCELPWHDQTERFILDSTTDSKRDYYSVFKNPLQSAWRWREQLEPSVVDKVLAIAERSSFARPYLQRSDWNQVE